MLNYPTRRLLESPTDQPATGDFLWGELHDGRRALYIRFPNSSAAHFDCIHCREGPDLGSEKEWGWDGNMDCPTLTPSILNTGEWHGHLVKGVLESCPDSPIRQPA